MPDAVLIGGMGVLLFAGIFYFARRWVRAWGYIVGLLVVAFAAYRLPNILQNTRSAPQAVMALLNILLLGVLLGILLFVIQQLYQHLSKRLQRTIRMHKLREQGPSSPAELIDTVELNQADQSASPQVQTLGMEDSTALLDTRIDDASDADLPVEQPLDEKPVELVCDAIQPTPDEPPVDLTIAAQDQPQGQAVLTSVEDSQQVDQALQPEQEEVLNAPQISAQRMAELWAQALEMMGHYQPDDQPDGGAAVQTVAAFTTQGEKMAEEAALYKATLLQDEPLTPDQFAPQHEHTLQQGDIIAGEVLPDDQVQLVEAAFEDAEAVADDSQLDHQLEDAQEEPEPVEQLEPIGEDEAKQYGDEAEPAEAAFNYKPIAEDQPEEALEESEPVEQPESITEDEDHLYGDEAEPAEAAFEYEPIVDDSQPEDQFEEAWEVPEPAEQPEPITEDEDQLYGDEAEPAEAAFEYEPIEDYLQPDDQHEASLEEAQLDSSQGMEAIVEVEATPTEEPAPEQDQADVAAAQMEEDFRQLEMLVANGQHEQALDQVLDILACGYELDELRRSQLMLLLEVL